MNTAGKGTSELTVLHAILPRLEAYHEKLLRSAEAELTPQRAEYLTLAITGDEEEAAHAYCSVAFARPLV